MDSIGGDMSGIKLCEDCGKQMTEDEIFYLEYMCNECETKAHEEFKKQIELERAAGEG